MDQNALPPPKNPLDAPAQPTLGINQAVSTIFEAQMNRSAARTAAHRFATALVLGVVVRVVTHVAS